MPPFSVARSFLKNISTPRSGSTKCYFEIIRSGFELTYCVSQFTFTRTCDSEKLKNKQNCDTEKLQEKENLKIKITANVKT